jgi:hypothetical protein
MMHPVEEEFRARREEEAKRYEAGVKIIRRNLWGKFKLYYIPTGITEDSHTGEKKERRQACFKWRVYRGRNLVYSGYKFNPFPLEDAVDLAFSEVERSHWSLKEFLDALPK